MLPDPVKGSSTSPPLGASSRTSQRIRSIGFTVGWVAVCGLSPQASMRVITSVVAHLEETPKVEGRVVGAFANDVPCWIAPVPDRMIDSYLGLTEWWRREHHDGQPPSAKQIIVCDPAGRFPWDQGCHPRYRSGQSLLLPQIMVREPRITSPEQSGEASATG